MKVSAKTLWLAGGAAALVLTGAAAWVFRKQISRAGAFVWSEARVAAFKVALGAATAKDYGTRALKYADAILQVASEEQINPFVLAGVMAQESGFGKFLTPPDETGTGDGGHGRGLMQLDDRGSHGPLHDRLIASGEWRDPVKNIRAAVQDHLRPDISYFASHGLVGDQILRAALASYNHGSRDRIAAAIKAGQDPETLFTDEHHTNYSNKVLALVEKFSANWNWT